MDTPVTFMVSSPVSLEREQEFYAARAAFRLLDLCPTYSRQL